MSYPGETSLNIIHPTLTGVGANLNMSNCIETPTIMDVGGFKLEKVYYNCPTISSGETDGVGNRLEMDCNIVFNNIPDNVDPEKPYYTSFGVAIYDTATEQVSKLLYY